VQFLEEAWRASELDRQDLVQRLARKMADPITNLLEVNLIAYALASAGEDGVTALLDLLSHKDFAVHGYAAEGLGSLDNRARWAVPALCRALERSYTQWSADIIVRALGNIGGDQAIAALQSLAASARGVESPTHHLVQGLEAALASAFLQD
jgi:HEAT repeat protein